MEDKITKRITLFIVTLSSFLAPFDGSSVNIALPSIGREFAMDAVSLGWVATAYLLSSAMFLVPFGRIADIHGRKKIYIAGIFVFAVSSLFLALSTTAAMLISLRILQGIGSAMIFGTGIAILSSVFPPQERGKALGIAVSATYLGLTLGPFLGGFLTEHLSWRSIFLVNVPLGIIIITLALLKLKGDWSEAKGEKFDLSGSIIYSLGVIALMLGFSGMSRFGKMAGTGLILAGVLTLFIFVRWEMRQESPVVDIRLFIKNKAFAFSNLAALINYSATFAITFFLSLYLQYIKGMDPSAAGAILIAQPVIMTIASPFAGRLSDRIEPAKVASIGMAILAAGLFMLVFVGTDTSMLYLVPVLILIGFGFALFSSPNSNAIMSSVEKKYYGIASGMLGTMRLTGQMLSMGLAVLIFAIYIGHNQITPEYHPAFLISIKTGFIIFGVLSCFGIVASLARGKIR